MTPRVKSILGVALVGVLLVYLAGDLWWWHGPLRDQLDRRIPRDSRLVARVFHHKMTQSQLHRAVMDRLWLEGKSKESLTSEALESVTHAALDAWIDQALLDVKAEAEVPKIQVSDAAIDTRLQRFRARFESMEALKSAMKSQGVSSEAHLRDRLAAQLRQEAYVSRKIDPRVQVTEEEARQWFEKNASELACPERVEVRHLFLSTLDHPSDEAKATLEGALEELTAHPNDFALLAKKLSEDAATEDQGGSLGWMTRRRLPADFSAAVFSLPLHKPTLVRTRLGWHLVEVTGRKPAESRTFAQAKPEILAALEAVKRPQVIREFQASLRQLEQSNIEVYHDVMSGAR